jgi:hypothetical protein
MESGVQKYAFSAAYSGCCPCQLPFHHCSVSISPIRASVRLSCLLTSSIFVLLGPGLQASFSPLKRWVDNAIVPAAVYRPAKCHFLLFTHPRHQATEEHLQLIQGIITWERNIDRCSIICACLSILSARTLSPSLVSLLIFRSAGSTVLILIPWCQRILL